MNLTCQSTIEHQNVEPRKRNNSRVLHTPAGRVRLDTLRVDYLTIIRERRKRSGSSLSLPSCRRQVISHAGGIVENPLLRDLHGNIQENPDMMATAP